MRYFIQFSYFGAAYHGWQKQPNAITVQQVLEQALALLLEEDVPLVGAGRTDAGVHAKEMYAHFNYARIENKGQLIYRLNAYLPKDIAVQAIFAMSNEAHARFDATARTYEYWVCTTKNPFFTDTSYYVKHPLDLSAMNTATDLLLGRQDFACFSKSKTEVNNYFCNIANARWTMKEDCLVFSITADRFLRNMVRAIVGTLLAVGVEKILVTDVKTIIKSKDRKQAGVSVPAKGLYLTGISYPNTIFNP